MLLKYMLNICPFHLHFYKHILKYVKAKFIAMMKESMYGVVKNPDSGARLRRFKFQLC